MQSRVQGSSRIINGSPAVFLEIPWRCAIYSPTNHRFCSCTIISESMVMSAAHCFDGYTGSDKISVFVGYIDYYSISGQWNAADSYVQHPSYNSDTLVNDIALVHLLFPLKFSPSMQPACLPFSLKGQTLESNRVTVSGWGRNNYSGSISRSLMKAVMTIVPYAACQEAFTNYPMLGNNICASGTGTTSCFGDSGGSIDLVVNGRSYAVGITSIVHATCDTNYPNIFTRVSNHLDWIVDITGKFGEQLCQA